MNLILQLVLLVLGFTMLVKGADWFVEGASGLAEKFGIPQLVIGLTIVAMGTSMPEAAVSIAAALKGSADITIGNVVGSNILNVFMILGLTAVVTKVAVGATTIKYEIPFVILITIVMMILGSTGGEIAFAEGVSLWLFFIGYLIYLLKMSVDQRNESGDEALEEAEAPEEEKPLWKLLVAIVVGAVLIVWGSDISVEAASEIARMFGLSERLIGLTIVAFGTSLPELVTSVAAATKGKADIAIGNIVGSNIFNILFVVGTTALVTPVTFASKFMIDAAVSAAAVGLLWLCVFKKQHLDRKDGVIFLLGYAAYFVYLLIG
ncbi:MAG: calcium/sodium antiporter [Lachnospiraceae bacterium]|nr:calcium/sodium antiporter [Lachnospiraceae bacterium]